MIVPDRTAAAGIDDRVSVHVGNASQLPFAGGQFDRAWMIEILVHVLDKEAVLEEVVDDAWNVAVGNDFQFSETTGPKPVGTDHLNWHITRVNRKAHTDGRLADAFNRVVIMEERPTSLFRPSVMWRVLKPSR